MHPQRGPERLVSFATFLFVLGTVPIAIPIGSRPSIAAEFQPDYLKFGAVRVGAAVEGSVRIFRERADASIPKPKVEAPTFVRIMSVEVGTQKYGSDTKGFCDIAVSIDTQHVGDQVGRLRIEIGEQRVEVPISVSVQPQKNDQSRVLVVETPFNKFSTSHATDFAGWLRLVETAAIDASYLDVERGKSVLRDIDLERFDVVLLAGGGLVHLLDPDIAQLKQFVERGGRVILAANHFFQGTIEKANELVIPYGLRMIDTESNQPNEFDVESNAIVADPLTEGVKVLYFHRPSPTTVMDGKRGKLLVRAAVYPGEGWVAMRACGRGGSYRPGRVALVELGQPIGQLALVAESLEKVRSANASLTFFRHRIA